MGLFDDAIREHLELKLRTGAEPGEIARVEQEDQDPLASVELPPVMGFSAVGQETAELDMRTVLDGDADAPAEPAGAEELVWEMPASPDGEVSTNLHRDHTTPPGGLHANGGARAEEVGLPDDGQQHQERLSFE
jgi:hypothetical protein